MRHAAFSLPAAERAAKDGTNFLACRSRCLFMSMFLGMSLSRFFDVPHLYVPMSAIFIAVYTDCKKLLGISDQTTFDLQ
jgi:hypothetical protein